MNFWSFENFKKNKAEPGSYLYRNRFLQKFKKALLEKCMGTRFLPIQEPVPEYIFQGFSKFSTWNPVPTHTGTGSYVPKCHFLHFWQHLSILTQSTHTHTNPIIGNTKIHQFASFFTSIIIFLSVIIGIWHPNQFRPINWHNLTPIGIHSWNPRNSQIQFPNML